MKKVLIGFLILNLSYKSSSQQMNKEKLDAFFSSIANNQWANGSIAISKTGNTEYQKEFGFALKNKEKQVPTNPETKYRIGSVSKMFTAIIIFQLIEEKKLQLDHTLSQFLSNVPNANRITIETLLRHQSGLVNYTDDLDYDNWKYRSKPKEELLHLLSGTSPKFSPGSKYDYSNTNYLLLSYIIETVCKKLYQEVLTERILARINLKNTYFENVADSSAKNSTSYKYSKYEWIQQPETVASNHLGAGAIVSTPTDLLKFMHALFSHQLLTFHSLKSMTTVIDECGMGIFKISYNNTDFAFGHEGRIDEFYTSLIHYPKENITIAYCTNGILYPRDDIIKKVTDICFNRTTTIPDFETFTHSPEVLNQLTGTYISPSTQISVSCKLQNDQLVVTTQGQDFDTRQIDENYFTNLTFGYFFEFDPNKKQLTIKETDNKYLLHKVNN